MKVKELMELLAKCDADAEVELDYGEYSDGSDVEMLIVDKEVIFESYHGFC